MQSTEGLKLKFPTNTTKSLAKARNVIQAIKTSSFDGLMANPQASEGSETANPLSEGDSAGSQ